MGVLLRRPLVCLLPLQAALLLYRLDLLPVWGDEQFTLDVIRLPWAEIPARLAADIHPPLYYALLKLWSGATAWLDPLLSARAFSVVWVLATGVVADRFWLRGRPPAVRLAFLLLWTLAPILVLYGRMARSYSLQTFLACLAMAAGVRLIAAPNARRVLLFAAAAAALLWTHYLPGIAVTVSVLAWLTRRAWKHALGAGALVTLAYAPWLAVLSDALDRAAVKQVYQLSGSGWMEHLLRLAYTGLSFSAGEAHWYVSLVLALGAGLLMLRLGVRGAREDRSPLAAVALTAAVVAYLGAATWVSYPFMPARLLFLFPVVLLFAVRGWGGGSIKAPAYLAIVFLIGTAHYFLGVGYLNKGYLVPYGTMAESIRDAGAPESTLVIADASNADPSPLRAALGGEFSLVIAGQPAVAEPDFAEQVEQALDARTVRTIWYLRSARDITAGKLHEALEARLKRDYRVETALYLPYSGLDRLALGTLTGEEPPTHHFQMLRFTRSPPTAF